MRKAPLRLAGEELLKALNGNLEFCLTEDQLLQAERQLSTKLVSALAKRQEHRGSGIYTDGSGTKGRVMFS